MNEALNNVTRHSGAEKAWVRLHFGESTLQLEVEDRGTGFSADGRRPGLGMVAMRERAELLGGSISFQAPASGGTVVRLTVPKESVSHESREAHA